MRQKRSQVVAGFGAADVTVAGDRTTGAALLVPRTEMSALAAATSRSRRAEARAFLGVGGSRVTMTRCTPTSPREVSRTVAASSRSCQNQPALRHEEEPRPRERAQVRTRTSRPHRYEFDCRTSSQFALDDICDEPEFCAAGTHSFDCGR